MKFFQIHPVRYCSFLQISILFFSFRFHPANNNNNNNNNSTNNDHDENNENSPIKSASYMDELRQRLERVL
ncbi:unnamed protein product, partial [Rotaria magnacalcarata]